MESAARVFHGEGGLAIAADVYGSESDPAVLFLHGGGQTRHAWGDAARHFADAGYFTVALDSRGHGDSAWPEDGNYEIWRFVADLRAVLDQLPAAVPPALVGASLGGITSLLAVGNADREIARALILVDIVPKINPEGVKKIHAFMSANPGGFATLDDAADAVAAYMPHRPRPGNVSGLKKNLRRRDGRYYWHWDPQFIARLNDVRPFHARADLEAAARNVRIPTLMVKGSLSEIVDDEAEQDFRRIMPTAEIVSVQGAGHMVAGDKNTRFAAAVGDFLMRYDRSRVPPKGTSR